MPKALRWVVCVAAVLAGSAVVFAALTLQRGDRWPQPAAHALAAGGGHVFLGRGNILTVLDEDLSNPVELDLPGEVLGIFYAAGFVYVAAGNQGLLIVDATDPAAPAISSNYLPEESAGAGAVFVSGTTAYLVGSALTNRFIVLDVSDPANPQKIGGMTIPGLLVYAVNLAVEGGTAVVADQANGLHLIDVTNPLLPDRKSISAIPGASDVALSGGYAYVVSATSGLTIVNVADAANPVQRGSLKPAGSLFQAIALAGGDIAYAADANYGLQQVNIADRQNPLILQTYPNTAGAYSIAANAGAVFECDTTMGLQKVLGGSGSYRPPAGARDLFIDADHFLYVVDSEAGGSAGREGMRILDAFNAGNLVFKGFVRTPGSANAVFVNGNHAYVADGASGVQIVDVSDKSHPALAPESLAVTGTANDVAVSGGYAYVAAGGAGLAIFDLSNPSQPAVGTLDLGGGTANALFVAGDLVYVADGDQGLVIVDVANKSSPLPAGSLITGGTAYDVTVSGNYAYVAAGSAGLAIVDVSKSYSPTLAGQYDTGGAATGVDVQDHYARIADDSGGLLTLDVANPAAPVKVDAWSAAAGGRALKLVSSGEYLFVAEDLGGAAVYRLFDYTPFTPAPFNPPGESSLCFIGALMESTR